MTDLTNAGTPDETWYMLPFSADPTGLQLAASDALLVQMEARAAPVLRWYVMGTPAVVLGVGQKLSTFDLAACAAGGVALHRRASGGTAVRVEPDLLLLDIALPRAHPLHRRDVTESYRWLGELWVALLAGMGLPARLLPVAEARADKQALDRLTQQACYGGRSPYEVLVAERKVIGLAQVRRRGGAVLQAGVYWRWQPERLVDLLALTATERAALTGQLAERVAGLADLGDLAVRGELLPRVQAAFAEVLRQRHGVALADDSWTEAALSARAQAAARYAPLELPSPSTSAE
jgi:lipoate-protein ligase A